MNKPATKFRVLVGMNYPTDEVTHRALTHGGSREDYADHMQRVEVGDIIDTSHGYFPQSALPTLLEQQVIEPYTEPEPVKEVTGG